MPLGLKEISKAEKIQLLKEKVSQNIGKQEIDPPQGNMPLRTGKIKRISEYQSKKQEYLFKPYVPKAAITILCGNPGSSKTWFSLYLAALVSTGKELPCDSPWQAPEQGYVIYQSKENDTETVVRPRLEVLGANLDNILLIEDKNDPLTLIDPRLEEAIKEFKPKLVIFDPIQSYLGADIDMHRANEIRPIMDKIGQMATEYQCSFLIVMHFSKMTSQSALDRILGSADFRAAARSILVIGQDPEDPKRRIMAHAKINTCHYGDSISYHIDGNKGVVYEGITDLQADDIISSNQSRTRNKPSASLDEACEFLADIFEEKRQIDKCEIIKLADERGISERTLYRAKGELHIKSGSAGYSESKKAVWYKQESIPP